MSRAAAWLVGMFVIASCGKKTADGDVSLEALSDLELVVVDSPPSPGSAGATASASASASGSAAPDASAAPPEASAALDASAAPPASAAPVVAAAPSASGSASAAEPPKSQFACGAKGQKLCPMQGWMKGRMARATNSGDPEDLAGALEIIAAKPVAGYSQWTAIAAAGAAAARAGDIPGAKASCKKCHQLYKKKYVTTLRDQPW